MATPWEVVNQGRSMKDEPFIPSAFILELIDPVTTEPKGEAWTSICNCQFAIVNCQCADPGNTPTPV